MSVVEMKFDADNDSELSFSCIDEKSPVGASMGLYDFWPGTSPYFNPNKAIPNDDTFSKMIEEHQLRQIRKLEKENAELKDMVSQLQFSKRLETPEKATPDYRYGESELLSDLKDYIDSTYSSNGHYSNCRIESAEVIIDRGRGIGFFLGNVDKYSARYGKKGTHNDHRKDLMKILHYALMALYAHDLEHQTEQGR